MAESQRDKADISDRLGSSPTVAEEVQHFTAQAFAEEKLALSATTAALDEARASLREEQKRVDVGEKQVAPTIGDM